MARVPLPDELRRGPFRVSEAIALDLTAKRIRPPRITAPFHGARSPEPVTDLPSRCRAYEPLMLAGQWFSHTTAARLWGLPLPRRFERDDRLHVSTRRREPQRAGVVGHRITAKRELRFHLGFLVSSPADAWCELASATAPDGTRPTVAELVAAGDRLFAWPEPLATPEEVKRAMARFAKSRGIRSIMAAEPHLRPASASARETALRMAVLAASAGFPEPECNGEIELGPDRVTHGDLVFREYRVVLEYDGDQHRTSARQWRRDVDRLNDLGRAGWLVIRIHAETPESAWVEWLESALRSRGWSPRPR